MWQTKPVREYSTILLKKRQDQEVPEPFLIGTIATRIRDLVRQVCMEFEVEILKGHVSKSFSKKLFSLSYRLRLLPIVQSPQ